MENKALWIKNEIIYCTTCRAEIGRVKVPHSPGEPITEDVVDPVCKEKEYFDLCPDCGKEWFLDFQIGRKVYGY